MNNIALLMLGVALVLELLGTAIIIHRLSRKVRMLVVWLDAVDEAQDWLLERDVINEKRFTTINDVRASVGIILDILDGEFTTKPLTEEGGDCWSPDQNNFDSYDDQREWEAHLAEHPDAKQCEDSAEQPADPNSNSPAQ